MKIREVIDVLDAELITGSENLDYEINSGFGSDLMSDVMAFVSDSVLLLTGLINPQVIRTAELMDIKCIVFVRGKRIDSNMIELAKEKGITILTTRHTMFIACGKLYGAGLTGRGARE